jgi:hypothetical protein
MVLTKQIGVDHMLYIVRYYDLDVEETTEYEYASLDHALETYNTLKDQENVLSLCIMSYNFETKEYKKIKDTVFTHSYIRL